MTTCVVMAVWELEGFRLKNHRRAILQTPLPTFVVELEMGGGFKLPETHLQISAKGRCWRKENILNLLEKVVPPEFDHIIWNDSGVALLEKDLGARVEAALAHHPFIQPFSECAWIGPGGGVELTWHPRCLPGPLPSQGLVWATKRSTWKALGGLWDRDVLDSTELERVLIGLSSTPGAMDWAKPLGKMSIGYAPGKAVHYWHKLTCRLEYDERLTVLRDLDFDHFRDLEANSQGAWEIINPAMAKFVSSYVGRTYA